MAYDDDITKGLLLDEHDPRYHDLYQTIKGGESRLLCTCGWASDWCDERWWVCREGLRHLKAVGA